MTNGSTYAVERPPVSQDAFSKIPFGPSIRRLRPGSIKVLAAVIRSSWVDRDTRRRVSLATNRRLAELAAVADAQTIAKHLAELAEAGAITFEEDDGRRVIIVHERAEGIGDMFVSIQDSHPAWTLKPGPFVLFMAVRSFDFLNVGYSLMRNRLLAERLNWSGRAVERAMAALRSSGTVTTVSIFNPSSVTRKRVVYAPNPTPNPEENVPGGYEKAGHLYGVQNSASEVRKNDGCTYEKMTGAPTKNCHPPLRKSGACITNSENEFLKRTATTNQPTDGVSGQSESAALAEAEVVVVDVQIPTDTDQEPKPGAGAEAPPELAEVAALLVESKLARDEQERYLAITRKMTEAPPMAWHRYALNVKKTPGMKDLAAVVISRLKKWMTTPPGQRAEIVQDTAALKRHARLAAMSYDMQLTFLRTGDTTTAAVRRSWEQMNAALAAAGQPPVMLDNAVLHAEEADRKRAAIPNFTVGDMMAQHAAKREQAAALAPTPPVDPAELERRRLARAERERVEQRSRVEAEQAKEVEKRVKAFEQRALMLLTLNSPAGLDAALTEFRTTTLPKKLAEIEAEVRAEFAPRLAALAPPSGSTPAPPLLAAVHAVIRHISGMRDTG